MIWDVGSVRIKRDQLRDLVCRMNPARRCVALIFARQWIEIRWEGPDKFASLGLVLKVEILRQCVLCLLSQVGQELLNALVHAVLIDASKLSYQYLDGRRKPFKVDFHLFCRTPISFGDAYILRGHLLPGEPTFHVAVPTWDIARH